MLESQVFLKVFFSELSCLLVSQCCLGHSGGVPLLQLEIILCTFLFHIQYGFWHVGFVLHLIFVFICVLVTQLDFQSQKTKITALT